MLLGKISALLLGIGIGTAILMEIAMTVVVSALVAFIFLYPWIRRIMF